MISTDLIPIVKSAAVELQEKFGIKIIESVIDTTNENLLKILEKCPGKKFTPEQKKAIAKAVLVITSAATSFGVSAVVSVIGGVVSHGSSVSVSIAGAPVLAALIKVVPYLATSGAARKSAASTLFAVHQTKADIAMLKQLETFIRATLLPVLPAAVKKAVEKGMEAVSEDMLVKAMKKIFKAGDKKLKTKINYAEGIGRKTGRLVEA